jgi:ankyrin repeat protein
VKRYDCQVECNVVDGQAADGNAKNLLLLLEAGADTMAKQDHQIGFSAINQAAYFGHAACLRYLLAFKADANYLDGYGGTPLVAAALNGEDQCVKVLLEASACVDRATANGTRNTPLMKATQNGHAKCVRMLIVAGADVELINKGTDDKLLRFIICKPFNIILELIKIQV